MFDNDSDGDIDVIEGLGNTTIDIKNNMTAAGNVSGDSGS